VNLISNICFFNIKLSVEIFPFWDLIFSFDIDYWFAAYTESNVIMIIGISEFVDFFHRVVFRTE
jgi:hypothetical protein